MNDIECPYCGEEQEINHDDGYGYEEGETFQQECSDCGKTFIYYTSIIYSYEANKADCLNGKGHDYQLTHTFPRIASKMRCTICDDVRFLTEDEKIKFEII